MRYRIILLASVCVAFFCTIQHGMAQDNPWLTWNIKAEPVSNTEALVLATVTLAPGWHIYSQYQEADGPPPTRITYHEGRSYMLVGETKEIGRKVQRYSDIFETQITWYNGTVTFCQRFTLSEPVATITGKIEYMTCNDDTCVPGKKEFTIPLNLLSQR